MMAYITDAYINGSVQDCSISIADTLEILQSCTKPLICHLALMIYHFPDEGSIQNYYLHEWGN